MGFANPLNAMQILWINILMDGPPAQRYVAAATVREGLWLPRGHEALDIVGCVIRPVALSLRPFFSLTPACVRAASG